MGCWNTTGGNLPSAVVALQQGDLGLRPGQAELPDIIEQPCCGLIHAYTLQALGNFMRGQWLVPVALS
ncbi:hypothetical protein [Stenotrophomonas maltophilia]|uniref:hypothetical protein n=1 Tax=Stenotrophomonas maltophilia TaxID=40324 RepID=UPI0034DAFE70